MYLRTDTKLVKVGEVVIGKSDNVVIQSMTNTKTSNVNATTKQIKSLVNKGCKLVRVAILDTKDLNALETICKNAPCPIIADIHYNCHWAIEAIRNGAKKVRINPGTLFPEFDSVDPNNLIDNQHHFFNLIDTAKKHNAAIRLGMNYGSLPKGLIPTPENIVDYTIKWIKLCEKEKFYDIVVSLKSTSPMETIKLYTLAAKKIKYPLHLGVTEAGSLVDSTIKSTIGLRSLLMKGIGDTIRISISGNPEQEPLIAKKILNACGINQNIPNLISCPTCGRCQYNFNSILNSIQGYIDKHPKNINVAVMGCSVNGIGESKKADIGVYGLDKDKIALFFKGKQLGIYSSKQIIKEFINKYNTF